MRLLFPFSDVCSVVSVTSLTFLVVQLLSQIASQQHTIGIENRRALDQNNGMGKMYMSNAKNDDKDNKAVDSFI